MSSCGIAREALAEINEKVYSKYESLDKFTDTSYSIHRTQIICAENNFFKTLRHPTYSEENISRTACSIEPFRFWLCRTFQNT